jgi:hypothetical protein
VPAKNGEVQVEATFSTTYKCVKPELAAVSEYYDDYIQIKNVKVKGVKGIYPQYGMFTQENVFFSDSKSCYFKIPFTEIGSEAVFSFDKLFRDSRCLTGVNLSEPYFVSSKTVKVIVPDWMQVDFLLRNSSANISSDTLRDDHKQITTYIFQVTAQPEYTLEENSPGYKYSDPYLMIVPRKSNLNGRLVTYFNSIGDLYQWSKKPLDLMANDEALIRQKSEELVAGCRSDEEKIRKLSMWVQHNIRYVAFLNGISGFKPDDAQSVIGKKYGDCKGMSNLLKCLLLSQGFDARLVWVSTLANEGNKLDAGAPVPFANHMICSLFWNDSIYFIDPTVGSLSFREIPEHLQGQQALIEDKENYIVSRIPTFAPAYNRDSLSVKYAIRINTLVSEEHRSFRGDSKHAISYSLNSMSAADRDMAIVNFLKERVQQDTLADIKLEGLESFQPQVSVNYKAVRRSNINSFGGKTYINIDVCKDFEDQKINIPKRKSDLKLPFRDYRVRVVELDLPAGHHLLKLPEDVSIVRDKYLIKIAYRHEKDKIIYRKEISILDPIIKKGEFKQWNSDIDSLRKAYNDLVILTL